MIFNHFQIQNFRGVDNANINVNDHRLKPVASYYG